MVFYGVAPLKHLYPLHVSRASSPSSLEAPLHLFTWALLDLHLCPKPSLPPSVRMRPGLHFTSSDRCSGTLSPAPSCKKVFHFREVEYSLFASIHTGNPSWCNFIVFEEEIVVPQSPQGEFLKDPLFETSEQRHGFFCKEENEIVFSIELI